MPKLELRQIFFGGTTFCCCLPVRVGVICMATIGMILSGVLTVVLWFEVSVGVGMSSGARAAFIIASLVETFLFIACILGLVGAIVRKQLFVQIYAYFTYVHLVLNLGVAAWLLWEVNSFSSETAYNACEQAIKDPNAQKQCIGFLRITRGVYYAVAGSVLAVELYGAFIVARYLNQVQREKRLARAARRETEHSFKLASLSQNHRYSSLPSESQSYEPPRESKPQHIRDYTQEFDPYEDTRRYSP